MTPRSGSIEKLNLEDYADTPVFNTKAAVLQTGVSAPTLRAWERRYKLLSPERADNTYRLYSERDIAIIRWLKARVDAGMAISKAVALFLLKYRETPQTESRNEIPQEVRVESFLVEHIKSLPTSDTPQWSETFLEGSVPYGMPVAHEGLIKAFTQLDEATASSITSSMMAIYPLEQVCNELITPTMWHIGQLWADGVISISVEHFACNFFRALLTNLLHVAPIARDAPLAIICCAPGEPHELAPLMLALFLRRGGLRIVYLGQNIESTGLVQTVRQLEPALLCISLTMPDYIKGLLDLAQRIEALPRPRPLFAFGGQGVTYTPEVIPRIPGIHLTGSLEEIVLQLHGLLAK